MFFSNCSMKWSRVLADSQEFILRVSCGFQRAFGIAPNARFSMKMWNRRLTASQTDDSHTVVVGISDKYLSDLKVQQRCEHEHRSAVHSSSNRPRRETAVVFTGRNTPNGTYNLGWSTLADFSLLMRMSRSGLLPVSRPYARDHSRRERHSCQATGSRPACGRVRRAPRHPRFRRAEHARSRCAMCRGLRCSSLAGTRR